QTLRRARPVLRRRPAAGNGSLALAYGQVFVGRPVAHFRHEVVASSLANELRHRRVLVAEIAEMTGAGGARGHTRRNAVLGGQIFIVDLVDAKRALLHDAGILVELPRPVRTGPGTELAADAGVGVHKDDAVLRSLIGSPGRADGYACRLLAVQTGAREMNR